MIMKTTDVRSTLRSTASYSTASGPAGTRAPLRHSRAIVFALSACAAAFACGGSSDDDSPGETTLQTNGAARGPYGAAGSASTGAAGADGSSGSAGRGNLGRAGGAGSGN